MQGRFLESKNGELRVEWLPNIGEDLSERANLGEKRHGRRFEKLILLNSYVHSFQSSAYRRQKLYRLYGAIIRYLVKFGRVRTHDAILQRVTISEPIV